MSYHSSFFSNLKFLNSHFRAPSIYLPTVLSIDSFEAHFGAFCPNSIAAACLMFSLKQLRWPTSPLRPYWKPPFLSICFSRVPIHSKWMSSAFDGAPWPGLLDSISTQHFPSTREFLCSTWRVWSPSHFWPGGLQLIHSPYRLYLALSAKFLSSRLR